MAEAKRKLAAILAADLVGFGKLVVRDEEGTAAALDDCRTLFRTAIDLHEGRVVDTAGDSVLAVFESVVEAIRASIDVQEKLAVYNADRAPDGRLLYRIGVNLGDIMEGADGTVIGDGVVVAARLESLADPGGIMISESAHMHLENRPDMAFTDVGSHKVKNRDKPVRVYRVGQGAAPTSSGKNQQNHTKAVSLTAFAVVAVVGFGLWFGGVFDGSSRLDSPTEKPEKETEQLLQFPDKASVAVLPFDNLSAGDEHTYIADGLHENLISTLSLARRLFVPARFSTLKYRDVETEIAEVGQTLGVEHVLEGSVQVARDRVRITVQLIEVAGGGHIWSERYDEPLDDIFALQDAIAVSVLNAVQIELTEGAQALRWRGGTRNLQAWLYHQQGIVEFRKFSVGANAESQRLFAAATSRDPGFALAWAYRGWAAENAYVNGYTDDPRALDEAWIYAARALELDPELSIAYSLQSDIHLTRGEYDDAITFGEKAIALSPGGSLARALQTGPLIAVGRVDEALAFIDEAMRRSPIFPDWYLTQKAHALLLLERYNESGDLFLEYHRRAPDDEDVHLAIVSLARAGRENEARMFLGQAIARDPQYSIKKMRLFWKRRLGYQDLVPMEAHLHVLRELGVPETSPTQTADKPSIAVLPFENLSNDPEQDYFAQGIGLDFATMLGRYRGFRVAARSAGKELSGADARKVAAERNVDFVLGGSVRTAGDRVRVEAYLADSTGSRLWGQRYDHELTVENLFEVQDNIARKVLSEIATTNGVIISSLMSEVATKRTSDLTAYQCVLRTQVFYNDVNASDHAEVRECLENAVATDPTFVDAWAWLSDIYRLEHLVGLNPRPGSLDRALDAGQRALALDPSHPWAIQHVAGAYFDRQELDRFFEMAGRALEVSGDVPDLMVSVGFQVAYAGQWERGIAALNRALELDPKQPTWINIVFSINEYRQGNYERALAFARRIDMTDYWRKPFVATIALAQLGRIDEAKQSLTRMLELYPAFADDPYGECRKWNWSEDLIDHMLDGLQKAGLLIPPDPAE